ncbi:MAG: flagellar motor switch protein FliG [Thermaerobacterales bacterium]
MAVQQAVRNNNQEQLSNRRKAAVLMISLGPDVSAKVFQHLSQEEIEELTLEIAGVRRVPKETRDQIFEEFRQMALAQDYISQGGIDYARELLDRAIGSKDAAELLDRLTTSLQVRPFDFIRGTDPAHLLNFIQSEHPQTIALILSYLPSEQAALILSALPPERQPDVAKRIAVMDRTSPEIISEVESVLEQKLSSLMSQDYTSAGGIEAIVQVLNNVDRSTERSIMDVLEVNDPELAEEIKKRMFVFEDILLLDDRSIQRVLRDVDMNEDLPLALKVASDDVKEKLFANVSKRAGETLQENMEFLGPVRLRDVEEAQQNIVGLIRRLEEEGEIVVARGQGDEIVV